MDTRAAKADVRRVVLAVTITAFSIAALMGIAALLGADSLGDTGARVLLTTTVVGCASVVTLCCLVVVGGRYQLVGGLGFAVTLGTTVLGLLLVWSSSEDLTDNLLETFGVAITASLTLAQICLVLGLAGARRSLGWLVWSTVGLALLVAGMVTAVIYEYDPSEGYLRALGIIAILDVLGTLVTIALGVFGRDDQTLTVTFSPDTSARLRQQAAEAGHPVRDLVDEALTRYLAAPRR